MDPERVEDLFDAMSRAVGILGVGPPSLEAQREAHEAAESMGAKFVWTFWLDPTGKRRASAGLEAKRGTVWVDVGESWEDALRELGLCD